MEYSSDTRVEDRNSRLFRSFDLFPEVFQDNLSDNGGPGHAKECSPCTGGGKRAKAIEQSCWNENEVGSTNPEGDGDHKHAPEAARHTATIAAGGEAVEEEQTAEFLAEEELVKVHRGNCGEIKTVRGHCERVESERADDHVGGDGTENVEEHGEQMSDNVLFAAERCNAAGERVKFVAGESKADDDE